MGCWMRILLFTLVLSCTADKPQRKQDEQPRQSPTIRLSPRPSLRPALPTADRKKDTMDVEQTQTETPGKETAQTETPGKDQSEDDGAKDEQEVEEPNAEELIVTLYFDPSLDLLQPLLKFSDPKAVRDIELQHAATTLKLPDEAHGFLQEGLGLPQLVFQLELNWRGASCHKLIEVKDTTQPTEVVCK